MVQQVDYEVQVQQYGRWSIHARFAGHERDPAIEEGKQLDSLPSIEAVKVIKEVFDTDTESTAEFVVYKSATLKSGSSGNSGGNSSAYTPPLHPDPEKTSPGSVMIRTVAPGNL